MIYVFSFFSIRCCLSRSAQHHPEGKETPRPGQPKSMVSNPPITQEKTPLNMKLLDNVEILFQANPVSFSHACRKCLGQGKIRCKFEMHGRVSNQGTGNWSKFASPLCTINFNEHLAWGLPTDAWCHSDEHADLNSPLEHTAQSVAQPPVGCWS